MVSIFQFYAPPFNSTSATFVFFLFFEKIDLCEHGYQIGILTAIAGTSPGDTMISDLIAGFIFHGKPLAVMSCFAFANPILGE